LSKADLGFILRGEKIRETKAPVMLGWNPIGDRSFGGESKSERRGSPKKSKKKEKVSKNRGGGLSGVSKGGSVDEFL